MAKSSPTEEFLITDPEAQPGVVRKVEAGIRPLQLLEPYMADHDVHCAFCPQHQLHKHGYFALLPDGSRALCGNVCAEEYFDKATVAMLDRKRDQLASARLKRMNAEAIIGNAAAVVPLIDLIAPNEWAAEEAIAPIGRMIGRGACDAIQGSDVLGVTYLGKPCRALGDARGGIASILLKAEGVTDREAEQLIQKRAKVLERIEHGISYLHEAVAFFDPENLHRFKAWMTANRALHNVTSLNLTIRGKIGFTIQNGVDWAGEPRLSRYEVKVPSITAPNRDELLALLGWG